MAKKRKEYSYAEKIKYHENRLNSSKFTEKQKQYSKNWLDGALDSFPLENINAAESELRNREHYINDCRKEIANKRDEVKQMKNYNNLFLRSYINGMKAKMKSK